MSGSCMPKEQYEYIKSIQDDCLKSTNMTEQEAWSFAFRCWQLGYAKIEPLAKYYEEIAESIAPLDECDEYFDGKAFAYKNAASIARNRIK